MTFSGDFFSFKNVQIFTHAFQLSSKTFPCIFLACLHFVSEKNEDKISKHTQRNKRNKRNFFSFLSFALLFRKIQALLKEKKIHLKKSLKFVEDVAHNRPSDRVWKKLENYVEIFGSTTWKIVTIMRKRFQIIYVKIFKIDKVVPLAFSNIYRQF